MLKPSPAYPSVRSPWLLRLTVSALILHALFSLFSAFAFATFLKPPFPDWLATPVNQRAMAIGFTYGGQTTVLLGAMAGLAFLMDAVGKRIAIAAFLASFTLSLASELAGTRTGFPFGSYQYTDQLGIKIAGLVPFNIPTSWFYMLVASLVITSRISNAKDTNTAKWKWAVIAALILTAWDVSMDPAMVRTNHWMWLTGNHTEGSALVQFFTQPVFYGMPLSNWLGWLLTGVVVARVMLAIIPPSMWRSKTQNSSLPIFLYAINGVLPITICFTHDMVWAGLLGSIAMILPIALAAARNSSSRPLDNTPVLS